MAQAIRIRTARPTDEGQIRALGEFASGELEMAIEDRCVAVATRDGTILAFTLVDPEQGQVRGRFGKLRQEFAHRLISRAEQQAVQFGRLSLKAHAPPSRARFWVQYGYLRQGDSQLIHRSFRRRQTRYGARIRALNDSLEIPADYGACRRLPLQRECDDLTAIGKDVHGREQRMEARAAAAWRRMHAAAESENVTLQVVSAFRDVDYQAGIVRGKLERGIPMEDILGVSAAPGFSEHHTGRALDITTPGSEPLEEEFETTDAYSWLEANAGAHRFRMSYPRKNRHSVAFEPWHWYWTG